MSNLYVFVITFWESGEPVILDDYCDGLTHFSPSPLTGVHLRRNDGWGEAVFTRAIWTSSRRSAFQMDMPSGTSPQGCLVTVFANKRPRLRWPLEDKRSLEPPC